MSNNKGKHQSKLDSLCQLPPDIPAIKAYLKELNTQAQHVAAKRPVSKRQETNVT